jgi:hypothetical protein
MTPARARRVAAIAVNAIDFQYLSRMDARQPSSGARIYKFCRELSERARPNCVVMEVGSGETIAV